MPTILNPTRTCPECGETFTAHHGRQVFCTGAHQRAFHERNAIRGKVALPFLQVWRKGKRGRTDATAYALGQLAVMADLWNEEDRKAGRRPDVIIEGRLAQGWVAADTLD